MKDSLLELHVMDLVEIDFGLHASGWGRSLTCRTWISLNFMCYYGRHMSVDIASVADAKADTRDTQDTCC
jgi:hypothetical protein